VSYPRTLPLFDSTVSQGTWNERMSEGEYAVHYSAFSSSDRTGPYCTVFADLESAVAYAQHQVAANPTLQCRIYDHHGLAGQPAREISGSTFKWPSEITARFRRWGGSILFFGGAILFAVDWANDFNYAWPSLVGSRIVLPGLVLLFIEAMIILQARLDARKQPQNQEAS
jgi:hypothetical protein